MALVRSEVDQIDVGVGGMERGRGRDDFIPGGEGFDPGEVYAGSSMDDAYRNDAQVGYSSVYADYQEKATQSLQNSYIPAGLKDLVKDYFSSLAPSTK